MIWYELWLWYGFILLLVILNKVMTIIPTKFIFITNHICTTYMIYMIYNRYTGTAKHHYHNIYVIERYIYYTCVSTLSDMIRVVVRYDWSMFITHVTHLYHISKIERVMVLLMIMMIMVHTHPNINNLLRLLKIDLDTSHMIDINYLWRYVYCYYNLLSTHNAR